ncbi:hypothetical protein SYNPS1DRAFT_15889, partial [Syncephalis pseudoplumigaleata]
KWWTIDGMAVGLWQEDRNLTYARIFNGSHMVSVDKARETFDMINRFMGVNNTLLASEVTSNVGAHIHACMHA